MNRKKKIILLLVPLVLIAALFAVIKFNKKNKEQQGYSDKNIPIDSTAELWYRNAVIYTLDVEVFKDSDGDGVGDFKGVVEKLGYIDSLGIDIIWLAPFQPTPNEDDGYDVTDFYGIDKRLGTVNDFKNFMSEAHKHGLKVIMDLVLNHTSIRHPWYQKARTDPNSPYRSWYTWSRERPKNYDVGMVFPGVQKEIWSYDSTAKEYYYHRFYKFQPDLNQQNPAVQEEMRKVIKYWIGQGLYGFRLDAVPFFIEVPDTRGDAFEHQFEMLTEMRSYLQGLKKDAIVLGEANVLPEETEPYFGKNGDAMHLMFNFFVNQHLFYALATGAVKPLAEALKATEKIPKNAQWGQFLRNHDEVDLGRLSNKERNEVYDVFGPEKNMQLYDRGIRRRLAPMMNNNLKQLQLAYSVLFSLPSTPVIRYGDEIGMGDDLTLKERESVRTPMQWSAEPGAGFSSAARTVKPVIDTGKFGYQLVNVNEALHQPNSLLNFTKKLIRLRGECPEIAFGNRKILETNNQHILAMRYDWQGQTLLVVHNFSKENQQVALQKEDLGGSLLNGLLPSNENITLGKEMTQLDLRGYDYRWYRMK